MYKDIPRRPHSMIYETNLSSYTRKQKNIQTMTPISEHRYLDMATAYNINNNIAPRYHSLYIPSNQPVFIPPNPYLSNNTSFRHNNNSHSNHMSSRHNPNPSRIKSSKGHPNIRTNSDHTMDEDVPLALLAYQKGYTHIYPSANMADGRMFSYISASSSSEDSTSSAYETRKLMMTQHKQKSINVHKSRATQSVPKVAVPLHTTVPSQESIPDSTAEDKKIKNKKKRWFSLKMLSRSSKQ